VTDPDREAVPPIVDRAVDNDILIKAIRYGEVERLFPSDSGEVCGFLDAARFVVKKPLRRAVGRAPADVDADAEALFAAWTPLQPTDAEVERAAEIEFQAQHLGVSVDSGEAQLAAIAMGGRASSLATGDKRAIAGLERIVNVLPDLARLAGRIWCFEQLVRRALGEEDVEPFRESVCRDREADTAITICLRCTSPSVPDLPSVVEGLESYIRAVRESAVRLLASPIY
jgi:hypothetical protein